MIFAQGGRFGGWAIFVEDGYAGYLYNDLGERKVLKSSQPLPPGSSTIVVDFRYDGEEKGAGGDVNLIVNEGTPVSAHISRTIPSQFSIDEGADVACDRGSPVVGHQLGPHRNSRFTGEVKKGNSRNKSTALNRRRSCYVPRYARHVFEHPQFQL